ncbi:E3 ubiquitin-protein ligase UPL3 [Auxenochlorella protothecoides]|uniref:HECT-type E3 ubiquitin transferase n=1 Tax=Auxenochlorella protothecoides TaxID=3075 RepID=A0A087SM78_AUXPR|nr:E3 ubiquitin-protein ligase UPL3 [Auxenochlorella protothecoides]KFM26832.1 E3 ubiquitin-protein ligase UPL3 [Auxenochlorella protothecoides]
MDRKSSAGMHRGHSALQGLLRRLGAGFEDVFHTGASSAAGGGAYHPGNARVRAALGQLRSHDAGEQLAGLAELCEYLAVSTEESLLTFPVDTAVPLLIKCLNEEGEPDVALLAARALTFLADVSGPGGAALVRHGAPAALVGRLLSIEYIDLAEQALQALQKLAGEHPGALLRAGALAAVLAYLDFFPLSVQRVAVDTAAALCRALGADALEAAAAALPSLLGLLQSQDARLAEGAGRAVARMAERYARDRDALATLCALGLVDEAAGVVALIEAVLPAGEDGDGTTTDGQPPRRLPHDLTLSLLPVLLRVSEAGTGAGLRLAGLRALATAAAASERSALRAALLPLPVSSSLARALRSGDEGVVAQALRAAELLLDAMPDACPAAFAREGAVRCLRDCAAALPDASAVEGLLARLASGEDQAVSTYELGSSGALDALWRHLQGKDLGQDVGARLARWSQFLIAGQRACAAAVPAADPSGGTHLGSLVHHALAALEASEKLAVGPSAPAPPPASSSWARLARSALGRGGGGSTADQGALAAGLETLSTPLNLRLCRAPGAEGAGVRDHGASVVSVVPMVTLDQVEDFLWLRVRDERSAPASRESLGAALAEGPPDRGDWASRLWNEVHRVTYRLWRAGDEDTGVALEAGSGRPARRTASRRRSGAADDAAVTAALASSDAPPRALAHLFADGFGEDGRLLDLPLSPLMWRMVAAVDGAAAEGLAPDLVDLETVDSGLAHGLRRLESAARAPGPARGLVDGVPLADLYLPADRLPGYPGYRLAGVDDAPGALVGVASAPRYIAAVLDATLGAGVARQVAAFRAGFAAVLSPDVLLRFQPEELELLLCGSGEAWTAEELRSAIHCDHGYTLASAPVRWLVEGAALDADADLPSVMTCANYIKLPPYSCKAVLEARLMYVLAEGQGSFDLS